MGASKEIKALLSLFGKKQADLMSVLNMGSKQSLSNKFANGRWSASDLLAVAEFCGCKLAFVLPDGQQIIIASENEEKAQDE